MLRSSDENQPLLEDIELSVINSSPLSVSYQNTSFMAPLQANPYRGVYNDLTLPIENPTFLQRIKHTVLNYPNKVLLLVGVVLSAAALAIYFGIRGAEDDTPQVLTTAMQNTTQALTTAMQSTPQALTTAMQSTPQALTTAMQSTDNPTAITSNPSTLFSTTGGDPRCILHEVPESCCKSNIYIC